MLDHLIPLKIPLGKKSSRSDSIWHNGCSSKFGIECPLGSTSLDCWIRRWLHMLKITWDYFTRSKHNLSEVLWLSIKNKYAKLQPLNRKTSLNAPWDWRIYLLQTTNLWRNVGKYSSPMEYPKPSMGLVYLPTFEHLVDFYGKCRDDATGMGCDF